MAKAFLTKLPDGAAEAFEVKVKESGRTAYAILQELAIEWTQRQPKRPPPPPPRKAPARPLWELLPKIDRMVREGVSRADEAFQALMREASQATGSPELVQQRNDWWTVYSGYEGATFTPMDVYVRGCCRRDEEDWRATLPKLGQKKAPPPPPPKE